MDETKWETIKKFNSSPKVLENKMIVEVQKILYFQIKLAAIYIHMETDKTGPDRCCTHRACPA